MDQQTTSSRNQYPEPPADDVGRMEALIPGSSDAPAPVEVGSRVEVRRVREVRTIKKYYFMKADSADTNWFIEWLLQDNQVYRNKWMKFVLNNLLFGASIGCFYMTIDREDLFWLYPLFWVDFLAQFFSFYFYYLYPRQFRIRAYTFFRTSVYIHEVLSMLAKLLLFVIVDGYDGQPTEIAALLGVFCCILLFFTENLVYYNKAFDSIWNMQNCVTVGMLLLKVSGLVEMSYETAVFVLTLWIFIIYHLNQLTGWFWSVCWIGSIFKWVRPENRVFFWYQMLQSLETQMSSVLQIGLCYMLTQQYYLLLSERVILFFRFSLEAMVILLGVVQIVIMSMQVFCQPDSVQIEDYEGIPQVEEFDLFVDERYSVTVDIDNTSSGTPAGQQEVSNTPTTEPVRTVQRVAITNPQVSIQPTPPVHSANHNYPRIPGESSGQTPRSENAVRGNAQNGRNGGAMRFFHTASTMLSRQNNSSYRQQSEEPGQTRDSFRPDEEDTHCRCCMERPKNAIIMLCYHFAYCDICTKEMVKKHKQAQDEKLRSNPQYVKKPFTCEFCRVPAKQIFQMRQLNSKEYIAVSKIYDKDG